MAEYIKTFTADSPEYARLAEAAQRMTERSPLGYRYYVSDTYFDFGQGWVWTTIICDNHGEFGGYQALSPRQQEEVITGDLDTAIDHYFADKWCIDKSTEPRISARNCADVAGLVAMYGNN